MAKAENAEATNKTEKVAKAFTAGTHGSTYGGHCVTCAASLASVTEILDNNLSENAKEMGEYMKQELAKLPHVKEARGRGLLVGCEYDIPIAVEVKHGCLDRMALITAIVLEGALDQELDEELGYSKYDYRNKETDR